MKKIRIITLLFCFAMLLCLIPVQAVKAEGNIVTYRFERVFAIGGLGSSADTHLTVTAIIDRETLKADVTFVRSGTTENDIKYIKENYPDSYEYVKHYLEQTHCHAIFDVEDYKNDDGNNGSRDYKLYDPVWDDNEPFLFYIESKSVDGKAVPILEDREVAYIYVSHVKEGSNGGKTDFGIRAKGKVFSYTSYHGIWYHLKEEETTPVKQKENYKIKTDNFSFVNTHLSFYSTVPGTAPERPKIYHDKSSEKDVSFADGTRGFLIQEAGYEALMSDRDKCQIAALNIWLNKKWHGSCLGMTIMSGLLYEGKISLNKVGGGPDVYSLDKPVNNKELASYIEYYQVLANFEHLRYVNLNRGNLTSNADNAKKVISSLKNDPMSPVVIGFCFSDFGQSTNWKRVWSGHAVLGYKLEKTSFDYRITVYDPNEPENERYIYITENGEASFAEYGDVIYIDKVAKAKDAFDVRLDYPEIPAKHVVLTANGDLDIISDGQTTTITGDEISGNSEVYAERDLDSDEITVLAPIGSDGSIRIRRRTGSNVSVQTGDTTALITDGANEIILNSDGSITAKTDGTEGTLAVASNKTKGDILGTTVKTKADEITITPTDEGALVKTNEGDSDITVSGMNDNDEFDDVDTSGGVEIKQDPGTNKPVITPIGQDPDNGTDTDKQKNDPDKEPNNDPDTGNGSNVRYTVKFDTDGGTKVSDKSVKKGAVINPLPTTTKSGYKFNGWYAGSTKWTSSMPVEKDMTLTAKWTKKENVLVAASGQKKQTVKAKVTYNGEKIALNVDMVSDKKITYTGKKITPEELGYKADFSELFDLVSIRQGSYKPEDLFKISYVNKNNLHKSTSKKKASLYAKISLDESIAQKAGLNTDEIKELKKVVKSLNKQLKKSPCYYTVNAVKISGSSATVSAEVTWKNNKISKVESLTLTISENGQEKTYTLKKGQYKIKVKSASKGTVVITGKGDFSGKVTVKTENKSTRRSSGITLAKDNDQTGYKPTYWSWTAEGEGYGLKYFTSGKYVRKDGFAVIYIESSDSPDVFCFQAFSLGLGARQNNYTTYNFEYGTPNIWISRISETDADCGTWHIHSYGNGCIEVTTDWLDEMYYEYEDPAGTYYLVREKY